MAGVADCISKLVVAGKISKATSDTNRCRTVPEIRGGDAS
jgi:hypothetical protein